MDYHVGMNGYGDMSEAPATGKFLRTLTELHDVSHRFVLGSISCIPDIFTQKKKRTGTCQPFFRHEKQKMRAAHALPMSSWWPAKSKTNQKQLYADMCSDFYDALHWLLALFAIGPRTMKDVKKQEIYQHFKGFTSTYVSLICCRQSKRSNVVQAYRRPPTQMRGSHLCAFVLLGINLAKQGILEVLGFRFVHRVHHLDSRTATQTTHHTSVYTLYISKARIDMAPHKDSVVWSIGQKTQNITVVCRVFRLGGGRLRLVAVNQGSQMQLKRETSNLKAG